MTESPLEKREKDVITKGTKTVTSLLLLLKNNQNKQKLPLKNKKKFN